MAEAVDEIGAAIPALRARGIRSERFLVHEQQFPDPEIAPDIERKRHVMIAHFARYGGQRFQIGKEVADVFDPGMRVGGIGKGREIMKPAGETPLVIAPTNSASVHRPMPSAGSGEIFGA
jgi:hypothetical protein